MAYQSLYKRTLAAFAITGAAVLAVGLAGCSSPYTSQSPQQVHEWRTNWDGNLVRQPSVYRQGLLFMAPAKHRARTTGIVDRIGETLERWLMAQIITMTTVSFVTWIGLEIIGIQSAFILGIQAGLLAFVPTVGAILAGLIVVLASLASGWVAALSAFILFLGVHALESYVLTPIIQRQALDIPPATLFAFQILLGVVFGIWGLALALPLMAIAKVMIDHFKAEGVSPEATAA